ncbi:UDP-4-amino-4,6-dideoxy-N-acetyl-beta-L-altrosamine transaminase [Acaryochloris sp. CCMEE 5410]|uniref:UDP-4-amino-4, 6-dideoxy-N-acetyl-beta-L-altrosamine transaminase n=1 Tax=Acaryochloris sp. CCMEE 5410 TaxID=310037 RepID=UPI00024841D2|nr:UDP-4-amino-4,6-dideoxy-N-acetyl-beta-L-altrosamine transaminase [Acaryochloris sp. CCMEE 5410]KAI9135246.1 UDP-4-amino-4,6-dideoxy-N-acetyl-beta-L-altrosamine transaminase [Acaryochloris sp. CCMEE 5410]
MSNFIPYGRQDINQADIDAVIDVLTSDYITQGPAIERFEELVANYCGSRYAVAVSSATAALHISCLALGLSEGDVIWTSPNTFVASANCGLYCGASVDFVDIDPTLYNLSVQQLENKLSAAAQLGKLPKVIIPVHFAGQSCQMEIISSLARQYDIKILEDASHAIGARYCDKAVGSCQYSDLTVFSFHPVKIITSGEGGMVLTNNTDLFEKLTRLRTHGITRNPRLMREISEGPWYYQQLELGYNYRMTDIQAALGASQMDRLETFVDRRRFLARRYNQLLSHLPIQLPLQHKDCESSWHLYVIRLRLPELSKTHRQIFEELRRANIGVNLHYIPVHTQPYYTDLGFQRGDFPEAEKYYSEAISIPLHYGLTLEQQDYIVDTLKAIVR